MTMITTILILAVALVASACAHGPINAPFAMLLLIIITLGLGFDWHDQSAEEIRHCDNARGYKDNHNK
jgi:uncharacterized protein YqgC (DUF456 family)